MKSKAGYSLENFFYTFLNRSGALVEKLSYGLMEAIVPPELADSLGTEELSLAFDYEVAQEMPGSIFIAPGSAVLDTAARLAAGYGLYTVHYWPGQEISRPKNLEQKISNAVDFLYCRSPRIVSHYFSENIYYIFNFLCAFRSFEKTEEIIPVAVNAFNGAPHPAFDEYWQNIVPREAPLYQLAQASSRPVKELYRIACREVEQQAEKRAHLHREGGARLLQKELAKTESYYRETLFELQKKQAGSGDAAKKKRLADQIAATESDWKRRQRDIVARYDMEVEVRLEHLLACCVPCLFLQVEVQHKNSFFRQTLVYNPLSGEVEVPPCLVCGRPAPVLVPDKNGRLACPAHEKTKP